MYRVPRRVSFDDPPALRQIAVHHAVLAGAIQLYYSPDNPSYTERFTFDTLDEVRVKHDATLQEASTASAMTVLASIEASFRVDYLQRNYDRKKDGVSRAFRDLYRQKHTRASFSSDILQVWKDHSNVAPKLVSEIRGALRYRDWLAHGRYWVPKLGRQYDFETIYDLGRTIELSFPFLRT